MSASKVDSDGQASVIEDDPKPQVELTEVKLKIDEETKLDQPPLPEEPMAIIQKSSKADALEERKEEIRKKLTFSVLGNYNSSMKKSFALKKKATLKKTDLDKKKKDEDPGEESEGPAEFTVEKTQVKQRPGRPVVGPPVNADVEKDEAPEDPELASVQGEEVAEPNQKQREGIDNVENPPARAATEPAEGPGENLGADQEVEPAAAEEEEEEETPEQIRERLIQHYESYMKQMGVLVGLFIVLYSIRHSEVRILADESLDALFFIIGDLLIWTGQILHHWGSVYLLRNYSESVSTSDTEFVSKMLSFAGFFWGMFGFKILYSQELDEVFIRHPDAEGITSVMSWQVWIRIYVLIILVVFIVVILLMVCGTFCSGGNALEIFDAFLIKKSKHVKRVPILSQYLKSRMIMASNTTVQGCGICLEEFCENDDLPLAELKCHQQHVFHLKCIEEWIERNDSCPLCRDTILPENYEPKEE